MDTNGLKDKKVLKQQNIAQKHVYTLLYTGQSREASSNIAMAMSFLRRTYPNQLVNYTDDDIPDALDLITAGLTTKTPGPGWPLRRQGWVDNWDTGAGLTIETLEPAWPLRHRPANASWIAVVVTIIPARRLTSNCSVASSRWPPMTPRGCRTLTLVEACWSSSGESGARPAAAGAVDVSPGTDRAQVLWTVDRRATATHGPRWNAASIATTTAVAGQRSWLLGRPTPLSERYLTSQQHPWTRHHPLIQRRLIWGERTSQYTKQRTPTCTSKQRTHCTTPV